MYSKDMEMQMKYRVLDKGDRYYPQYRYRFIPIWFYFREGNVSGTRRSSYPKIEGALAVIDYDKFLNEPCEKTRKTSVIKVE